MKYVVECESCHTHIAIEITDAFPVCPTCINYMDNPLHDMQTEINQLQEDVNELST